MIPLAALRLVKVFKKHQKVELPLIAIYNRPYTFLNSRKGRSRFIKGPGLQIFSTLITLV
ncbi:hypothetical protein GILI108418_03995 [Gillisia limnaea]